MLHVDVAIVGAGFSGVMVAVHLLEAGEGSPVTVALIERRAGVGRGVAYGTESISHLLNVSAGKMSAFPDQPEDFLRWLKGNRTLCMEHGVKDVDPAVFAPRRLYGAYLASILKECASNAGTRLHLIKSEVTDIEPMSSGALSFHLDNPKLPRIHASKVVLALGNFPPGDPPLPDKHFHRSERYLNDPWAPETCERLSSPGDVLILGSGLTSLDLLRSLHERKREGVTHIISRRGLFPFPHKSGLPPYTLSEQFQPDALPVTVRAMLRLIRRTIEKAQDEGCDWRAVIDALRPLTQPYWQCLPLNERRKFLTHLRAYWEPHRHRAPPEVLQIREQLVHSGQLVCHCGRLLSIMERGDHLEVRFVKKLPFGEKEELLNVRYVVNCTGPECNYHKLREPLVVQLFGRGLIRPDPLLLGLDTDEDGGLLNCRGESHRRVFTLGSPRRGSLLETTAVPEVRCQARDLARTLRRELAALPKLSVLDLLPDRFYAFDI